MTTEPLVRVREDLLSSLKRECLFLRNCSISPSQAIKYWGISGPFYQTQPLTPKYPLRCPVVSSISVCWQDCSINIQIFCLFFLSSKETQQLTAAEGGSKLVKSQTSWRALMMKSQCGGRWTLLTCFQMAAWQSYLWSCCWLHREGDLIPDNCWGSWRGGLEIQFLLKQLVRQSESQSLLSSDSSVSV